MKKGWGFYPLEAVCLVRRGTTITNKEAVSGDVPVVAGGLLPTYYHNAANRPAGTITVSASGANAGYVNRYVEPIFASDCSTINPIDEQNLLADFVFRFLQSKQQYISSELRRGSAQPHVYASDLGKLEIPIPPMDEQRRIVAVLDKAFAGIAAATANAHKNLSDARALFESYLQSVFTERRHGLVFKPLSEVCDRKPSKSEARRRLTPVDEVSFVPMNQLGIHKRNFVASETRALTSVEGSYTYFANGDVLLAKITPCFENGKLGIARDLKNGVGFGSSEFMVLRPKTELLAEYLYYFLDRAHFRETGAKAMTGAVGHKRVPPEFVESLEIAVRPIGDQRQIVTVLDALSDDVIKLQSLYQRKLASLNELKQSLLQKAFAGELT